MIVILDLSDLINLSDLIDKLNLIDRMYPPLKPLGEINAKYEQHKNWILHYGK